MQQTFLLALVALTAIVIAVLSLLRGDARIFAYAPSWMPPIGHFLFYALLAFLCTLAVQFAELATPLRAITGVLLATGFGAAMEYAQNFRTGRSPRFSDILIDAAGATVGAWLAVL